MKLGVIDLASGVIGYMAGDSPQFDGVDLAGVSPDMATTRKIVDAYTPVLNKIMEEQYGAKLLILFPSPPQVLFCRKPVGKVADLKGMKVRVSTPSMADLIAGLGATTVTMPFGEVTTSLERGVIDCGITGTLVRQHHQAVRSDVPFVPALFGLVDPLHCDQQEELRRSGSRTAEVPARPVRRAARTGSGPPLPRRSRTASIARSARIRANTGSRAR